MVWETSSLIFFIHLYIMSKMNVCILKVPAGIRPFNMECLKCYMYKFSLQYSCKLYHVPHNLVPRVSLSCTSS